MDVLLLNRHSELPYYDFGYLHAFEQRGMHLMYVPEDMPVGATLSEIVAACPARPSLIIGTEWEGFPFPEGLTEVNIPTLTFQQDTFAFTHRRIRWGMLFDYVIIFHAGFEEKFRAAGHSRVFTMPWAVLTELYDKPEQERIFDVGWVGRVGPEPALPFYEDRRRILDSLAKNFHMNDVQVRHLRTQPEMAEIYLQSKIVVNVCRDDFPFEANTRMFEAMGAGALLVVRHGNEIADLGFIEGTHFLSYKDEVEIVPLVRKYLEDEPARRLITAAAREKILHEHTYDVHVAEIQKLLEKDAGHLPAPARSWPEYRVRLTYLDYYAAYNHLDLARRQWWRLARRNLGGALEGAALIAGSWSRRWRKKG